MTYVEALHDACSHYGLEPHIESVNKSSDCYTYAEKIAYCATSRGYRRFKNSFMYLDSVDFCFYYNGNEFCFSISGNIARKDKLNIVNAVQKALDVCKYADELLKKEGNKQ